MRKSPLLFLAILIALYGGLGYTAYLQYTKELDLNAAHWVGIAGIVAAVTGWITTAWVSLHNVRRQHTVNVLLQSRLSQAYQGRLKDAYSGYPVTPQITYMQEGDWNDPMKLEAIEGIKYLLNYFEFLAIGIRTGDLDERTLRMSLKDILETLTTVASPYIKYVRGELETNDGMPSNDCYKELLWLKARWKKKTLIKRLLLGLHKFFLACPDQ